MIETDPKNDDILTSASGLSFGQIQEKQKGRYLKKRPRGRTVTILFDEKESFFYEGDQYNNPDLVPETETKREEPQENLIEESIYSYGWLEDLSPIETKRKQIEKPSIKHIEVQKEVFKMPQKKHIASFGLSTLVLGVLISLIFSSTTPTYSYFWSIMSLPVLGIVIGTLIILIGKDKDRYFVKSN